MDKREAFNLFFRRYNALFKQDPFLSKDFIKLKREFFLGVVKIGFVPRNSEIASEFIEYMIRLNQIKSGSQLNEIFSYPFFQTSIHNKQYFKDKIEVRNKQIEPLIDISKIKDAEYINDITTKFKEQAFLRMQKEKSKEIDELESKINEKLVEYEKIPSILDEKEYPLPDLIESDEKHDEEVDIKYIAWYKRLNLKKDPFLVTEGLARIDKNIFDKIIQKTSIFKKYDSMIVHSQGELFKNTVIGGQFGSGKTTFFDYFYAKLPQHSIYPIYIQLGGDFEVRELIFEFRKKLSIELMNSYRIHLGESYPDYNISEDQLITSIFSSLINKDIKNFVIIIDDLHKGKIDKAMSFLSYLQILTSELIRANSSLQLGIYIAGAPDWESIIHNNPKYSGSVARIERIPQLNLEDAFEAVNKRLKAYSINPNNPRQFDYNFIQNIFNEINNIDEVTFRNLITNVVNKLEDGNFDLLISNPIDIPPNTLDTIKKTIESDLLLRGRIHNLMIIRNMTDIQRKKCVEYLILIYLNNGYLENEIRQEDIPYLQQLLDCKLIIKVYFEGQLKWRICKELWDINNKIIQKHHLSIEDYLLPIYLKDITEEEIIIKHKEIDNINYIISHTKQLLLKELIRESQINHEFILNLKDIDIVRSEPKEIISNCTQALASLTKAYFEYEKIPYNIDIDDFDVLLFWQDFWWSPESLQQYIRTVFTEMSDVRKKIPLILTFYRQAYPILCEFFQEEIKDSRQFKIPLSCLRNDEIEFFHNIRNYWKDNEYYEIAQSLSVFNERKIRTFLYNIFNILYGNFNNRINKLDDGSKKYILENIKEEKKQGFSISTNEFQQLNRAQYKNFMTGIHNKNIGRNNWENIFKKIFHPWKEQDLDAFLDQFANINIRISHLKEDSINVEQMNYIYAYILNSIYVCRSINTSYLKLLESDQFKFDKEVKFSFNEFKDESNLEPISVSKNEAEQFRDILKDKDSLKISLDDKNYIQGLLGLNYRIIFALLATIINQTQYQIEKTKTRIQILKTNGCEICVRLYSNSNNLNVNS